MSENFRSIGFAGRLGSTIMRSAVPARFSCEAGSFRKRRMKRMPESGSSHPRTGELASGTKSYRWLRSGSRTECLVQGACGGSQKQLNCFKKAIACSSGNCNCRSSILIWVRKNPRNRPRRSGKRASLPRVIPRDQNPEGAFWNTAAPASIAWRLSPNRRRERQTLLLADFRLRKYHCLATRFVRLGLAGILAGNASAMATAAADSACSCVFAEVSRSRAYQLAREETDLFSSSVSSNSIDFNFFEADSRRKSVANWRLPPAHNTNRATRRSASRSPLGPSFEKSAPRDLQEFPTGCG